ncbi:MAG TPA: SpoIIE family protein phosphatase [Chthoniobacter sp.]|jgi:serine phosphatase RsbU (regulator of sigma subunit)
MSAADTDNDRTDELAKSLAMLHATLESTTDAIIVTDEDNYVCAFNEKYAHLWQVPTEILPSIRADKLWNDYICPQLTDPVGFLARAREIVGSALPESFDVLELKDGRVVERNSAIQRIDQRHVGRVWSFRDITQRKRTADALAAEKRVLEQIASGTALSTVLDTLVRGVEAQSWDGLICSVLVMDEGGERLRHGAAPSLPEGYNRIVDGVYIGPRVGSCGSAAFKREPVFATDIATDPHWSLYVPLAKEFGLGACCSTPVFSSEGVLLGTVAMYYRHPHEPSAHDRELIRMATHLAGIVIERNRAEEQLRAAKLAAEERAREIKRAYDSLRSAQEALNAELSGAVDYVRSLLPRPIADERVRADWRMTTSAHLGGDGLGYHWLDPQKFAFYLLDVSGHGVKSALLAVSILDTLRTHSLPDTDWTDPGAVLAALNHAYLSQAPGRLHFTIAYGVFDIATRQLRYAAGGHPPAVLRGAEPGDCRLPASGPPVGCFANAQFPTVERPLQSPADLYLFSDGVFDARRHEDENALDQLIDYLVEPGDGGGRTVAEIHTRAFEFLRGAPPPDDCSVLKVSFS